MTKSDLIAENKELREENAALKRMLFGRKSETFINKEKKKVSKPVAPKPPLSNKKKKPSRQAFPEKLERVEIILEPTEDTTDCKKIGEEVTEILAFKPATLYIIRYVRPKYAKPKGEGILISELPARCIEKGSVDSSLLIQILIDKFIDHLPIYRQIKRYLREGIKLSASTLNGWQEEVFRLLEPLFEELVKAVLKLGYLQADETPIKVLDPGNKKNNTHRGYHWVYHSPEERIVFFDYQTGRGREGPQGVLKDFKGYLQTDGYGAYKDFDKQEEITLTHCMAHARRYFEAALGQDPERAGFVLSKIQQLYALERAIKEDKDFSYQKRAQIRQDKALPILEELKNYLDIEKDKALPKSLMGKAITYALNQWKGLKGYLLDGKLEIDNNLIENAIRPHAVGRKNYLFAGSHHGARRAAMFYSFFGTCQNLNINPSEWLKDVLDRMPQHPINKIHELLPHNWAKKQS